MMILMIVSIIVMILIIVSFLHFSYFHSRFCVDMLSSLKDDYKNHDYGDHRMSVCIISHIYIQASVITDDDHDYK